MLAKLREVAGDFVGLIYPCRCLTCQGQEKSPLTHLLCEHCLGSIASKPVPPVHFLSATASSHLAEVHAGWQYDAELQQVIHAFKYRRRPSLSRLFGTLLAQRLQNNLQHEISQALLVPVPLHPRRGRERGFNQSILLAQAVANAWNIAVQPRALKRVRFTQSQATLDAQARAENVKEAFAPAAATNLPNHTVLLVDDVFTTGATMSACAAALKVAGAARVIGLALAKAG